MFYDNILVFSVITQTFNNFITISEQHWLIKLCLALRLAIMEPPATRGRRRPAVKVKMEVKEEPEYVYVDETVSVASLLAVVWVLAPHRPVTTNSAVLLMCVSQSVLLLGATENVFSQPQLNEISDFWFWIMWSQGFSFLIMQHLCTYNISKNAPQPYVYM